MAQSNLIGWLLITIMLACAIGVITTLIAITRYIKQAETNDQTRTHQTEQLTRLHNECTYRIGDYTSIQTHLTETLDTSNDNPEHLVLQIEKYALAINELTEIRNHLTDILEER